MRFAFLPFYNVFSRRVLWSALETAVAQGHDCAVITAPARIAMPEPADLATFERRAFTMPFRFVEEGINPFEPLTRSIGAPLIQVPGYNTAEARQFLTAWRPDAVFSISIRTKLQPEFIAAVNGEGPARLLNLHNGPLPAYRGLSTIFQSFLEGRSAHGVALHEIDREWDQGPVLAQAPVPLDYGESVLMNHLSSWPQAADLITAHMSALARGSTPKATPQDQAEARYFSPPTQESIRTLKAAGVTLSRDDDILRFDGGWAYSH